jgi:hypothetical protein
MEKHNRLLDIEESMYELISQSKHVSKCKCLKRY